MIAVTVGVGPYAEMARHAARRLARLTGLRTRILGDREFAASGLSHPVYLRFRVFDGGEDEDVLYFDADMVCLNPWDPAGLRSEEAVVAVRDRMIPAVFDDAAALGEPACEYFNAGLFIANRRRHRAWLREAEAIAAANPRLPFFDQSALNAARVGLHIPLLPLDRRYNWVCFGDGTLEYQVPVFMAHRLSPGDNARNLAYFGGQYAPPLHPSVAFDERATAELAGRSFTYLCPGKAASRMVLQAGGTIEPPAGPAAEGYWFVQTLRGRPVLTLASQTRVLHRLHPLPDGSWLGEDEGGARRLRPRSAREVEAAGEVVARRWFTYERVGFDRRPMEFLPGGRIGVGRGGCEETWSVSEQADGALSLSLGGRGAETCRMTPEGGSGHWRGQWLVHERMPALLAPLCDPSMPR